MNSDHAHRAAFALLVTFAAFTATAVTIDASYAIVAPARDTTGVTKAIHAAAKELAAAFKEGANLDLKVVEADKFAGGKGIFLGAKAAKDAGLLPADLSGFSNIIAEKDGNVYLFGRDESGRPALKQVSWQKCVLPTVKAIVRFMEEHLDVRFLAPGETGKDIPSIDKVEIPDGLSSRQTPALDYGPARMDTMLYSYATDMFGQGRYHSYGGHTYPKACPPSKYFKEHPEYFGLISGRRVGFPEFNPTLCISNPAVEDLIVEEMLRRYDEGAETVQLAQQDGGLFCECEKCRSYGGPKAKTQSERYWLFHRRIAERIAKLRPGKKVNILCYSVTLTPPQTFRRFPENVMIELCHVSEESIRNWTKNYVVPQGFVVYIYLWGNYPFLGFTAKRSYMYCANFVRMLRRYGVHGIYRCGYGELFGTEGPGCYVFNRLIDDPDADVNAVVEEYCRRAYGPAAEPMRKFHDTLDFRLRAINMMEGPMDGGALRPDPKDLNTSLPQSPFDAHAYVYTPETIKVMESCLSRAERLADTPKRKRRLALVRKEFDYAKNLGTIATLFAAYRLRPSASTFEPLADAVKERQAYIDALYGGDKSGDALPKGLPGWPEVRLLGRQPRKILETNGRLMATLGAPLMWDVDEMRRTGMLPGSGMKTLKTPLVSAVPEAGFGFESGAWSKAEWQSLGGVQAEPARIAARFKVLAGPDALHIAAESDIRGDVSQKGFERDGPVWQEENFSLMVAAAEETGRYRHFIWNTKETSFYDAANGLVRDPLDPMYGKPDKGWNGEWSRKNEVKDGKWRTCVAIPYGTLGAKRPKKGERWRFNIGRDANKTGRSADLVLLQWNPNFESRSLANDAAMGCLEFE